MNRARALGTFFVTFLVLTAFFNNCSRIGFKGMEPTILENGTSVGNPMQSDRLRSKLCLAVVRCHPQTSLQDCTSGATEASGYSAALALHSRYDVLSEILSAEASGSLVGDIAATQACGAKLDALSCSAVEVQNAYLSTALKPFANVAAMLASAQCSGALVSRNYQQEVTSDLPLAYWRFEEGAGTGATDSIGGHDGTYSSSVNLMLGVPGVLSSSRAIGFSGGGSRMQANFGDIIRTPGAFVTVEFWMRWNGAGGATGMTPFNIDNMGYGLWLIPQSSQFGFNQGVGDLYGIQGSTVSAMLGRWVHVVAVMENGASANNMSKNRLYINGQLQSLSQLLAPSSIVTRSATQYFTVSDPGYPMQGDLDEMAVYNFALSPEQILRHYKAGVP